jgi:ParB-like chromosome segregation protein Spo0J
MCNSKMNSGLSGVLTQAGGGDEHPKPQDINQVAGSAETKSVAGVNGVTATTPQRGTVANSTAAGDEGVEPTPASATSAPAAQENLERLMGFHPLSNIFPMMGEDELKKLADDIAEHGLRESITTKEGKILDGRHRYLGCQQAGVAPKVVEYEGDDLAAFVVSKNCCRRHLTASQRAAIAADLLPHFQAEAKKRKLAGLGADGSGGRGKKKAGNLRGKTTKGLSTASNEGRATAQVGKALGVNDTYVRQAASVKEQAPAVFEQMKTGKVTLSAVAPELKKQRKPAELPKEKVPKWLADAVKPVNGARFDVIFTDEAGLYDATWCLGLKQAERFFSHIATPNAILLRIHKLGEPVPMDICRNMQGERFITTVVIEGADSKPGGFNLDVRHRLLAVYMLGEGFDCDTIVKPKTSIPSLHKTDDVFQLIATWLPDCKKLFLSDAPAPEGWTHLSPKKIAAERGKA